MTTDEHNAPTRTSGPVDAPENVARSAAGPAPLLGKNSISVVIPAFNEAERIARTLRETDAAMAAFGAPYEIVLVDDGSSDDTIEHAKRAAAPLAHVRLIRLDINAGKGWALVRGAQVAHGELVMFMDADLDVHPRQLALMHDALVRDGADVVIGSKLHPASQIDYPPRRRVLSMGYYVLVRALFRLPVRDTQTGIKLYRREVLERIVPRLLVKRFAHDLEALVNAHRLGYRIVEVPVVVTQERPFPRIGLTDALLVTKDTAAIFYRTYLLRYYDRVGASLGRMVEVAPDRTLGATAAERRALALAPPEGQELEPAREERAPGSGGDAQDRP
jgi:glycosyltransferase involved in cell wall biosynthesis